MRTATEIMIPMTGEQVPLLIPLVEERLKTLPDESAERIELLALKIVLLRESVRHQLV